jgi:hypothetical protein
MADEDVFSSRHEPFPEAVVADRGIDELLASYAAWRESAAEVTAAYREWLEASRSERCHRHAAYLAALDQEEAEATGYEAVADSLRSSLCPGV